MREIKFRFWDNRVNKFRYDLLISNANQYEGLELDHVFPNKIYDVYNDYGGMFSSGLVKEDVSNHVVVQQYTGLKDKNGVEIYEGDTVRVTYERDDIVETSYIGEVEFGDCCLSYTSEAPQHGSMGFYLKTENQDEPQIGLFQDHNLINGAAYNEVVGNIFEGVDK